MSDSMLTRRAFQTALMAGGAALGTNGGLLAADTKTASGAKPEAKTADAAAPATTAPASEERDYPAPSFKPRMRRPKLSQTFIQDFVIYAHYDLDMVKRLYSKNESVLNATVDWGGGDWESALGAASHIGRRDIAEFLLSKGARLDIFAATMLGHIDVVKSLLTSHPELLHARGPHGFTLLSHAKAGKEKSVACRELIEKLLVDSPEPKKDETEKNGAATPKAKGQDAGKKKRV